MVEAEIRVSPARSKRVRRLVLRLTLTLAVTVATTVLVYLSGADGVAAHFYYLPIVYAGFALGSIGAVVTALGAAALCGPWVPASIELVGGEIVKHPQTDLDIFLRAGLFLVLGLFAARVSQALHRRAVESRTLYEVSSAVAKSLRVSEVLALITESAIKVIDAQACSIRLLDEDTGELSRGSSSGLSRDYRGKGKVTVTDSLLDQRVLAGEAVAIRNAQTDPLFQYPAAARVEGLTAVLSLPLTSRDDTLGIIRVYARRERDFRKHEVQLLRAFADAAAVAIDNAQLHDDVRTNYFETVRALTIAIEARDSATYSHSERVMELADKLAEAMGMPEEDRDMLRFGCILHDIGRIGLDERPAVRGAATEEEMAFYRLHPLIGRSILQPVRFLEEAMPIVIHHHERWDGSGFPEGLVGEETDLAPRIVGVVDEYERMVNPQETVTPLESEEALREILRGSGTVFDPDVVAAFVRMMHEDADEPEDADEAVEE